MDRHAFFVFIGLGLGLGLGPAAAAQDGLAKLPGAALTGAALTDAAAAVGAAARAGHEGVMSVQRRNGRLLVRQWEPGAARPTVWLDRQRIVDGRYLPETPEAFSHTLDPKGRLLSVAPPETGAADRGFRLMREDRPVWQWPSGKRVRLLSIGTEHVLASIVDKRSPRSTIIQRVDITGANATEIGRLPGCSVLHAVEAEQGVWLEVYCSIRQGRDVVALLPGSTGAIDVAVSGADEFIAATRHDGVGGIAVHAVSGSRNARHAFHAVQASLGHDTGEATALASDAAGALSWSQSYRTMAHAELFDATGEAIFARKAVLSMQRILQRTNEELGVPEPFNPRCAWASLKYSQQPVTPISLLVNQGMIANSLGRSCELLGAACPKHLKTQIARNAECLVESYEPDFDAETGLYRIQHGAPFRYDGIWAPWNWQNVFAALLHRVGRDGARPELSARAAAIGRRFLSTWELETGRALWRYWPGRYYQGWSRDEAISVTVPYRDPRRPQRYEDVTHAGISLMALDLFPHDLPLKALRATLDRVVDRSLDTPRDIDARGPREVRWLPAAGWYVAATERFRDLYATALPGKSLGDHHYTFAALFDPTGDLDLKIAIKSCFPGRSCRNIEEKNFKSISEYIEYKNNF